MAAQPIVIGARSLMRQAYDAGIEQRVRFGVRVSPFYQERVWIRGKRVEITELVNSFFFAGFDGEPYPEQPSNEVKPHAVDAKTKTIPAVEWIAADSRAERQDESGTAPESPTRAREKGADSPGIGTNLKNEVRRDVEVPAESH